MTYTRFALKALAASALTGSFGLLAPGAFAQTPQDLASIRKDMADLREAYEAKIGDLEARLAKAEADATAAREAAEQAQAQTQDTGVDLLASNEPVAAPATPAAQNTFNPGIAAVLNGLATVASNDPAAGAIAGFSLGDEAGGPARGFSMGESEVSFTANIDPSLMGFLDFSIGGDNDVSLEEAYIRTTALEGGFTLKAGRFLSSVGYLNERHAHDWSFSDAPLPYKAFFNSQLGDDGVQVRWIAPVDQYLEFGAEVLRGDAFPGGGNANNGAGTYTLFGRTGNDFDDSSSWLAGLSYVHAKSDRRESNGGADLFSGNSDLGIASFVYKWAPNGNSTSQNLALTSEIFYGKEDGQFNGVDVSQTHTGWYAQGVYQFVPSWSAGLRLAGLNSSSPGALLAGTALDDFGHSPFAATALLEYDTSEFGRLRLQYTRDEAGDEPNDVLSLQYTVIYGPHGAHRY